MKSQADKHQQQADFDEGDYVMVSTKGWKIDGRARSTTSCEKGRPLVDDIFDLFWGKSKVLIVSSRACTITTFLCSTT